MSNNPIKLESYSESGNNALSRQVKNLPSNVFSSNEIELIREMIEIHKGIKNTNFNTEKGNRLKKTYNIDKSLIDKVCKYAHKNNVSESDMINEIIKKFFSV